MSIPPLQDYTLLLKFDITLLLEPPEMSCDIDIPLPPPPCFSCFIVLTAACLGQDT